MNGWDACTEIENATINNNKIVKWLNGWAAGKAIEKVTANSVLCHDHHSIVREAGQSVVHASFA